MGHRALAQPERILTQHAENAHRAALTDSEQLGVVEQLSAFGMSAAQITKRTKIQRGDRRRIACRSRIRAAAATVVPFCRFWYPFRSHLV
ncbi:MAG TPA: hypothetical protein VIQ76_14385 [Propionibacteriaceae bacterium]|jgi:ParB family transcriptional regulator, chromosome partitioning protein